MLELCLKNLQVLCKGIFCDSTDRILKAYHYLIIIETENKSKGKLLNSKEVLFTHFLEHIQSLRAEA